MMRGGARQFHMVLDQHPVKEDGDDGGAEELAILVKTGVVKDDIVSLPEARGAADVDERRVLPVHGGRLPVSVNLAVDGVDDLDLVERGEKNAAIPWIESVAGPLRRLPLHMHLTVAEGLLRVDIARLRNDLEVAVADRSRAPALLWPPAIATDLCR